jgi:hypothetical protein
MVIVSAAVGVAVIGTLIYAGYLLGGRHTRQYPAGRRSWRRVGTVITLVIAGAAVAVMLLAPALPHGTAQTLFGAIPVATYFLGAGAGRFDGRKGGEIRGYDQGFLDGLEHGSAGVEH